MQLEQRLHTYQEAADVLNITLAGLRRMCEEGRGPEVTRIGRLRRFRPDSLLRFIEERTGPRTRKDGQP